jgi:hypothetical protein
LPERSFRFRAGAIVLLLTRALACSEPDPAPTSACVPGLSTDCSPLYDPPTFSVIFDKILLPTCAQGMGTCHTAAGAKGGIVMEDADDTYERLLGLVDQRARVEPGDPACSLLVRRLEAPSAEERMPPGPTPLSAAERCTIVLWIANGAAR